MQFKLRDITGRHIFTIFILSLVNASLCQLLPQYEPAIWGGFIVAVLSIK